MRKKRKSESNPFRMVLYTVVVLALVCCIGFQVYQSRQRHRAYQAIVQEAAATDGQYEIRKRVPQTETETDTEETEKTETEKKKTAENTSERISETSAEDATETESETETE
ncbi:MAG: hypothetical protein SOX32_05260 [Candidatus Choladocola sp.]|nr:hypothetical protein [Candidatus Choladocola sp.]